MIIFVLLLLVGGAGALIYGLTDRSDRSEHFADATIVDAIPVKSKAAFDLIQDAVNGPKIMHPVVDIQSGHKTMRVKLHDQVPFDSDKFPQFRIGGRVYVKYIGSNPNEAFLADETFGSTPVNFNPLTVGGICSLLLGIAMLVLYFFTE